MDSDPSLPPTGCVTSLSCMLLTGPMGIKNSAYNSTRPVEGCEIIGHEHTIGVNHLLQLIDSSALNKHLLCASPDLHK